MNEDQEVKKMDYQFKKIKNKEEIKNCQMFHVDHYMWKQIVSPKVYGWAGYLENEGIYVKMVCEEQDPLITCTHHKDMVCNDSAMEIFLAFCDEQEELTNDVMYLNFEINAFGAMYAKYGKGRHGRQFISEDLYKISNPRAIVEKDQWSIEVLIPEQLLKEVCDFKKILEGEQFYCNFYKIAENPKIEHYAAFKEIDSQVPNFHLPVSFAKAVVENK